MVQNQDLAKILHSLAVVNSKDMLEAYEALDKFRDADLFKLLAGPDADTKELLSPGGNSAHENEIKMVKLLQQVRTLGRKVKQTQL